MKSDLIRGSSIALVCGLALLSACSIFTEPLGYELPDPDLSLDPAALVQPRALYLCGKWFGGTAPTEDKIFVDVSFDRRTESDPNDRPTSRHIAALEKHGGTVVYKFHFPAVRAWIATANIPALAGDQAVLAVLRVANLRRYDWNASVGYRLPYSYKDGAVRYEQLGGRVDYRFDVINAIGGLIPDRSVAALREDRNVLYVEGGPGEPNCS